LARGRAARGDRHVGDAYRDAIAAHERVLLSVAAAAESVVVDRARAVKADFAVTSANARAIAEL
jgi:hypothetical protein